MTAPAASNLHWRSSEHGWTSRYGLIVERGQLWDILPSAELVSHGICSYVVGVASLEEAVRWFDQTVAGLKLQ